ncbi:MAG TPA: hypothetical protein VFN34_12710, partial [Ornithinibacter sp.]|nr:hypothetical protein [Ornithinibacter sp.]
DPARGSVVAVRCTVASFATGCDSTTRHYITSCLVMHSEVLSTLAIRTAFTDEREPYHRTCRGGWCT